MPRGIRRGERGPYQVYSDGSELSDRAADLILERGEHDFAQLCAWFGDIRPPALPLEVSCVPDPGGEPRSAAFHAGCGAVEVEVASAQPEAAPFLAATQLIEAFAAGSGGWPCMSTPGEALSQTLAFELYPQHAPRWNAEIIEWLNGGRADFITRNGRSTNMDANGCGNLFLRWLRYQLGFDWPDIIQAGILASCLGETYQRLTGSTPAQGWQRFQRVLTMCFSRSEPVLLATHHSPFPWGEALCTLTVLGFYDSALGIPADPMGIAYWLEQQRRHNLTLEELAVVFLQSPESLRAQIIGAYRRVLLRDPTKEELATWMNEGAASDSIEKLWKHLLLSEEYTAAHPSSGSFVRGIHRDILGIDPDVSALNIWVSALEAGAGRQTVLESFLASPAALNAALNMIFARVLRSELDPDTRAHYLARMSAGKLSRSDLLSLLLRSPALRRRLARDLVSALHWSVFDRAPTAEELDWWAAEIIEAGATFTTLTRSFLGSLEYFRRRVQEASVALFGHQMAEQQQDTLATALQNGSLSIERLWIELLTSPEYVRRAGDHGEFVQAVYRDLLGCKPTSDELERAQSALATGERARFLEQLLTSETYLSAYISASYRRFLGREPDSQIEVPLWINALTSEGMDLLQFEEALLDSYEFRHRAIRFRSL